MDEDMNVFLSFTLGQGICWSQGAEDNKKALMR